MSKARVVRDDGGVRYEWENDSISVRLGSADTGGLYTLTEDRMKPSFDLGPHFHRTHAETFQVLAGEIEFRVGPETIRAGAGTTVHVAPGIVHSARVLNGAPAHMLMIYAPAGFDAYLARLAALSEAESADAAFLRRLDESFDLHMVERDRT